MRELGGVVNGKRHTYTIEVEFVRPNDPNRIELSRTWKVTATDETGHVALRQALEIQDGQSDLLLDTFVGMIKRQAKRDFDDGT